MNRITDFTWNMSKRTAKAAIDSIILMTEDAIMVPILVNTLISLIIVKELSYIIGGNITTWNKRSSSCIPLAISFGSMSEPLA
jgi:hypothetical protein